MALIIYPTDSYDSFISVADATTVIDTLTLFSTEWGAITDTEKEIYLRIAMRRIVDGIDQDENPLPDPLPDCAGEAQALMAVQDVVYGISANTTTESTGSIKKQKVASLEIEYYDTTSQTTKMVSIIPAMARPCLEELGYELPPMVTGLKQTTLGRS